MKNSKLQLLNIIMSAGAVAAAVTACGGSEQAAVGPVETDSIVAPPQVMPDTFTVVEDEPEPDTLPVLPQKPIRTESAAVRFMNASPDSSSYAEGVIALIAKDSPEYAEKLLKNTHPRFIIADKGSLYVYLYDRFGREIKRYRMCAGKGRGTKHERGDSRTPEGYFSVEGIYDSTDWLFTDDNGVTSKVKGQFGPRFIRLRTPVSSQIGIHGTCAPWSLGARSSHGCMRIANESVLELVELVEPGMPVIVNPSIRDMRVNDEEGTEVTRLTLYSGPAPKKAPEPAPAPAPEPAPVDSTAAELPADTASVAAVL